jgi:hypothetical protein
MHRPIQILVLLLAVLTPTGEVSAAAPAPALVDVVQLTTSSNTLAWITARQTNLPAYRTMTQRPVWLGYVGDDWPPGLVPIYAIERRGVTELRRRPPRGQENFVDPLFLAVPAAADTNAPAIAGRWQVRATTSGGQRHQLIWELTSEGSEVSGRFDQNTEYRFAFINGGTWRSNRLELLVENVNEQVVLEGGPGEAELTGTWRRTDDSQSGTWAAERLGDPFPSGGNALALVDLFTWRAPGNPAPRHGPESPDESGRWQRDATPLCRVWRRPPPTDFQIETN